MAKEQTQKAIEQAQNAGDETQNSVANPAKGGRTTEEGGVAAIVNPELGNTQSVAFPDGEGGADVYAANVTHEVPSALLDVKNAQGVPYLVKKED
jgi:hypothetical protein